MVTEIVLKEQNTIVYNGFWNKELYNNKILQVCMGNITTRILSIDVINNKRYVLVSTDLKGGIA